MEPRPASSAALPASGVPGVVRMRPEPARLARRGQPWFFADDLQDPVPPETLVRVRDHEGRDLGLGLTSTRSKLALRLCGPWEGDGVPDREAFFAVFRPETRAGASTAEAPTESWPPRTAMILATWSKLARPGAASMAAMRRWPTPTRRADLGGLLVGGARQHQCLAYGLAHQLAVLVVRTVLEGDDSLAGSRR